MSIDKKRVRDHTRGAHDERESEAEVLGPPPKTLENDEACSGETRTLNLAGAHEQDEYQHPLE
jgi:hypothetical protein